MMSCLHHANAKQMMMTWCVMKCETPMMSCHLIPTWHEWNMNADDIMMTWLALYANLVTSCLACMHMAHMLYVEIVHLSIQVAWHAHKPT